MRRLLLLISLLLVAAGPARGQQPAANIGIDQRLGESVPQDLVFRDASGRRITLEECADGKPVVLALVYYDCPMLCNLILNGLLRALRALPLDAGGEFQVVAISFDPGETPELAAQKKRSYLEQYQRAGAETGWRFLTGSQAAIDAVTDSVGFRYQYDPETDEFAHASGLVVLTPQGQISRYFYGVEYSARDLKLALVEASQERIGSVVDQILLLCLRYDPTTGKYGLAIMSTIRVAGALTVALLIGFMVMMFRRDRRRAPAGARPPAAEPPSAHD